MMERYWGPTSLPWRSTVVGSWTRKKTSRICSYVIFLGSNVTWTTSACPVSPSQTASYEGLDKVPPEYPLTTFSTPRSCSIAASTHQKQPPPKVAVSLTMGQEKREVMMVRSQRARDRGRV